MEPDKLMPLCLQKSKKPRIAKTLLGNNKLVNEPTEIKSIYKVLS